MKTIYFVRHGQSVGNITRTLVGKDSALSEVGEAQALRVAERFTHLSIDQLFASDFLRAQQTALPISQLKDTPITIDPVFGEFLEPSSFFGVAEDDEEVMAYRRERNSKVESEPTWVYGDGETVADFMARITRARHLLETVPVDTVAVVSHAYFITSFIGAVLLNTNVPSEHWFSIIQTLQINNTGISVLTYDEGRWSLVTFNDRVHFAE